MIGLTAALAAGTSLAGLGMNMAQAIKANKEFPDYIAIGPVYNTKSKDGRLLEGIGVKIVEELSEKIDVPVVAIGGIDPSKVELLKKTGCSWGRNPRRNGPPHGPLGNRSSRCWARAFQGRARWFHTS